MSSQFGSSKSWVFSDPSLKKAVCFLQASSVCMVLLAPVLIMMGIVWAREMCRASFAYNYVFYNFVSIFGVTYLLCLVGPKKQVGTTARFICLGAKQTKFGLKGRFNLLSV